MQQEQNISHRIITKAIFIKIIIALFISLYFLYFALYGKDGFFRFLDIRQEIITKEISKNNILIKTQEKQKDINSLRLESLDLDFLDEKTRESIGFSNIDEIIIDD